MRTLLSAILLFSFVSNCKYIIITDKYTIDKIQGQWILNPGTNTSQFFYGLFDTLRIVKDTFYKKNLRFTDAIALVENFKSCWIDYAKGTVIVTDEKIILSGEYCDSLFLNPPDKNEIINVSVGEFKETINFTIKNDEIKLEGYKRLEQ